jgi:hypothetical protein
LHYLTPKEYPKIGWKAAGANFQCEKTEKEMMVKTEKETRVK